MRLTALALVLTLCMGCVHESVDGDQRVFAIQLWVPALTALVGLAVTAQGWYGKDGWIKSGWLVVVIGLFIVFVFAPSLLLDRTVVNQHGFSKRGGLWGLTVSHDIKFADMRVMRLTTDKVRDRIFSTSTRRYLVCDFKTGES